jgi:hypothetical protein
VISKTAPLTSDQQATVIRWIPYAKRLVRDLMRRSPYIRRIGFDEALSAACEGLVNAVHHHDPGKGQYSTIAKWHILAAVQRAAETLGPVCRTPGIGKMDRGEAVQTAADIAWNPMRNQAGYTIDRVLSVCHEPAPVEWEDVSIALASLDPEDREILHRRYVLGVSVRQESQGRLGTQGRIRRRTNAALDRLRDKVLERWQERGEDAR